MDLLYNSELFLAWTITIFVVLKSVGFLGFFFFLPKFVFSLLSDFFFLFLFFYFFHGVSHLFFSPNILKTYSTWHPALDLSPDYLKFAGPSTFHPWLDLEWMNSTLSGQRGTCLTSLAVVQELCESRGVRPGLSVLTSLLVFVDVKLYWTMLTHWFQLVPDMSTDIPGH